MRLAAKGTEIENLFETLANKSPVGLCIIQDGKFCYTNPTFQSNTGYREDELLGRDSLEIVVPEDRERVRENALKMLKGKLTLPYQFRVTHKDGSIHWVIESVASIKYRGRQATLGNFVDITERKQVEEALQTEKNKLQSLIDTMEDHITIRDRDYNLIYMAEHAKKLWGDRTGEKCYRVFEGQDKVCDGCPAEKAFKDGKSHTTERKTTIAGEVAFWENTANPIRDARGRIVACLELARDITEPKQAKEALQTEKNKLQSVIDAMVDGLSIQDRDYNIIYQNEPLKEIFGDHLGEKCYRAYVSRDKVCAGCPVAMAFRDGKSHSVEKEVTLPSGKVAFWEPTANPVRDAKGKIVSCLEIIRDITERKRAEEALQAERNKLKSLIDAMADGLNIQDTEYNIIFQNEVSRISTGGDRMGEKCYRVFEGSDKICDGCPVEKAFKDGKPHIAERMRILPSGEVTFWENTANPIRDAEGKVAACLEIGRNITERKKQEQSLADELTRRRLLVDQSLDGIVVLDVDAKVYEANQRFAEMLGYTLEEVRELHTWDWDKKFPPEKILEMGRNVDEKGLHLETQHTRKDGSVIDVDISINAAILGGQKLIFCVGRDVTERNRAEQALKDSEESYRELADSITDIFFAMDEHLRYTYWNKASEILTGIRAEDAIGKSLLQIFPDTPEMRKAKKVYRDVLRTQQSRTFANEFDINGRHYTFEISAYPSRGGISVFVREITERKQAEEVIQAERNKLQSLIDAMEDNLTIQDRDYNLIYLSGRVKKLWGDCIGEKCYRAFEGQDKVCDECPVEKAFKDGESYTAERRTVIPSGEVIFWENTANPIRDAEGRIVSCLEVSKDITERKKTEKALRDSEEKSRKIFESATDGMSVIDLEGVIVELNQRTVEMHGFSSKDELRGKSAFKLVVPRDHERIAANVKKATKQGALRGVEYTLLRADGSEFYGELSTSVLKDDSGNVVGYIIIARDITERKKMEEVINLQRAYFQQLFDNSPDAILMMDTNDRAIQANRGFEVLFGYSNEEVKGRSLPELIVPEVDVQEASTSLQRILGGEVVRKESVRRRKDGSLVDVSVLAYPIRSNDKLVGAYSVYSDITERKQAEEAIKQAAEEWRRTFDSITDAISIQDRDFQILRANKAFADLFKKSPRQIIGKHCYELHKGNKPISDCPHQQTLATGKPAAAEFYESHLEKHFRESTSPIFNDKGEVVGTVHITRDITEQKQQNEQLMMADRLASIGELAAGTAHELNNPLTSVIGFSQLLMEKDIPDDIREDVKLVYNEARRAADVTKNLLTFARKRTPVKQLTQINNIIVDVLKLRAYEQKVNGIQVKRRLAHDLPEIMVDYFQMQQVFLNIIINAEYFMTVAHNRGTLTINTKKHNSSMRISITDDGPGIPQENLSRIFDPFFTTKEAGKGTGLGLSICHGIVAEHGGQIYAKSQPGKGATFIVELPIKSPRPYRGTP